MSEPIFSSSDYADLYYYVFSGSYAGYQPAVKEIPNGDGKVDAEKRYAHIAPKYFRNDDKKFLTPYLEKAHYRALAMAEALELPRPWWPRLEYSALRVLDYPVGAVSNEHEDFDLFTLMCYRDQPDRFLAREVAPPSLVTNTMRRINEQAHLGQLGEAIGLGPATPHLVLASDWPQKSIVHFAIPDHENLMPGSDITVRDWLNERMSRSRISFKKY